MPFFLCDTIGSGIDAEANAIIPAVALYTDTWTGMADAPGARRMLVQCAHATAFDADARIRPLRRALLANWAPDEGEVDDWDAPDLALKVIRRCMLNQWLLSDDFGNLAGTVGDVAAAKRLRIRNRLVLLGIDISQFTLTTPISEVMRIILAYFKPVLEAGAQSPSGTFIDNFNGEASDVDLAAHTPSGGGAWTRVDGLVNMVQVSASGNRVINNNNDAGGALYQCTDQGNKAHYVQYKAQIISISGFASNRASNKNNHIGVRAGASNKTQLYKCVSGVYTQLGSNGATSVVVGDTIRLESNSSDSHTVFLNAVSQIGPISETANNTVTGQGLVGRLSGAVDWLDDFEAGLLSAAGQPAMRRFGISTPLINRNKSLAYFRWAYG